MKQNILTGLVSLCQKRLKSLLVIEILKQIFPECKHLAQ